MDSPLLPFLRLPFFLLFPLFLLFLLLPFVWEYLWIFSWNASLDTIPKYWFFFTLNIAFLKLVLRKTRREFCLFQVCKKMIMVNCVLQPRSSLSNFQTVPPSPERREWTCAEESVHISTLSSTTLFELQWLLIIFFSLNNAFKWWYLKLLPYSVACFDCIN